MLQNYELLSELVQRISYKPGYQFAVCRVDDDFVKISLTCPALPDAHLGNETVGLTISNVIRLETILVSSDALQAFASVIARYELHEAAEFFQLDGTTVFLPHRCGDKFGDFRWQDFVNLGGKHLRSLNSQLKRENSVGLSSSKNGVNS
jgi:hypothetical protein